MEAGTLELEELELDGYGSGSGDGYGYGSGSGSGDGSKDDRAAKRYFAGLLKQHHREDAIAAFWRSTDRGTPANGGKGTKASVGLVETIEGPLQLCTKQALHGTSDPRQWKGERWWIVALHHPIAIDEDKVGSLKRTFLADLGKCPL